MAPDRRSILKSPDPVLMPNTTKSRLSCYSDKKIASVCAKLVRALFSEWKLSRDQFEILLGPDADFESLISEPNVVPDTVIERIGLLVEIDKAACSLLPVRNRATDYLFKRNPALNGESAMSIMLRGSVADLELIYRFLLAELA